MLSLRELVRSACFAAIAVVIEGASSQLTETAPDLARSIEEARVDLLPTEEAS